MSNYPPGAEHDPNAPYNQPDYEWAYEKAEDIIKEEMDIDCDTFTEWLEENNYIPEPREIEERTYKALVEALSEDDLVAESYYEYRKEDVVQEVIDDAADEPDYDTRDEDRDYWLENEPY